MPAIVNQSAVGDVQRDFKTETEVDGSWCGPGHGKAPCVSLIELWLPGQGAARENE
jgi:hypothetical protein